MLAGDPGKGIPPLSETTMKERLWNMTIDEQEKTNSGFREKLMKKLKAVAHDTTPTDRRILMAETAWEIEYEKMDAIMPHELKNDLKKYYGKYKPKAKHRITARDNVIPNCSEVVNRMKQGIVKRMKLEYSLAAAKFEVPEAWKNALEKIENVTTPEEIISMYNKLEGKHWDKEQDFFKKRDNLQKNNPAAYDFFLRLYNKHTREKLYAQRDDVIDQAVANIDQAMKELGELTDDKKLLDLTNYESIEGIIAAINKIKEAKGEDTTDNSEIASEEVSTADLLKAKDAAETKLFTEDRDLRNLTIHEMALESAAKASEISERQSDDVVAEKQKRQMRQIRERRLQDQATTALENTEEREVEKTRFTDGDIAMNTTVIGTDINEGLEIKDSDVVADFAQILKQTEGRAANEGRDFITGIDQDGKKATAKNMKDAANDVHTRIESRKKQLLANQVKEGSLDAKVLDLSQARETKQERTKRRATVLNNIDKIRRAA